MSETEPEGPYIYQPYGMQHPSNWDCGRIYGIGGIRYATIMGLTKNEAELVLKAIKKSTQP